MNSNIQTIVSQVASDRKFKPGKIVDAFDPVIQRIVDQWPIGVSGERAVSLGIPDVAPLQETVEGYLDDFG